VLEKLYSSSFEHVTNQSIIVQTFALLCHSWLDQESSFFSWIPAFAGMTLCLVNYGLLSNTHFPSILQRLLSLKSYVTPKTYKRTAIIKFWKHTHLPMECNVKVYPTYSCISFISLATISLGSVRACTSSTVQPGATSSKTRPAPDTVMTAMSVTIRDTQRGAVTG
jgi:hypothetical protein